MYFLFFGTFYSKGKDKGNLTRGGFEEVFQLDAYYRGFTEKKLLGSNSNLGRNRRKLESHNEKFDSGL